MGLGSERERGVKYVRFVGGKIAEPASEDDPLATRRTYEVSDGQGGTTSGVKHEIYHDYLSGTVGMLKFYEGDYGVQMLVGIDGVILSVGRDSRYFQSLAERLASVDIAQPIVIRPYDFEDEKGKRRVGVTVRAGHRSSPRGRQS